MIFKSSAKLLNITLIEFKQSFVYWFFLIVICFTTGFAVFSAQRSLQKVLELIHIEKWEADLVILPKGISLEDFRKELVTGITRAYIPQLLYKTTLDLSKNQFQLQSVYPVKGAAGVLILSDGPRIGTNWLPGETHFTDWNEDLIPDNHPAWGKKLLAGIFAKGDREKMQSLKDLIDQRTVAQAFFVQDEQQKNKMTSDEIKKQIFLFIGILSGLILVGVCLIFLILKNRLQQLLFVFSENGMSALRIKLVLIIVMFSIILPVLFGYGLAFNIF